jgi:hypothetical protein
MRDPRKHRPHPDPGPRSRAHWIRVIRDAGVAAALAALRVLLNALTSAYPRIARQFARGTAGARPHKPAAR